METMDGLVENMYQLLLLQQEELHQDQLQQELRKQLKQEQ